MWLAICDERYLVCPRQQTQRKTDSLRAGTKHNESLVSGFVAIAVRTVVDADSIELPEPRTVWCDIPQSCSEQETSRFVRASVLSKSTEVILRNTLNVFHATFQNQSAVIGDLIATARQEFIRQ